MALAWRFVHGRRIALALRLAIVCLATLFYGDAAFCQPAVGEPEADATSPSASEKVDFAEQIQPLLARRCYECHGPQRQESNFRLDVRKTALAGGDLGEPAIVPGSASESPLWQYVAGEGDLLMPPEGKEPLTPAEVRLLADWIDQGADWPDELAGDAAHGTIQTDHWSLQPLMSPRPPEVDDAGWSAGPIDRFIFRRLQEAGLGPSPEADRATLIRRLMLDMHGLPPSPEQVAAFVADRRPDAYIRLVDQVLASPHYGERWARHWLDVVRFAETNGFETNTPRPNAYHYRDYVIEAFNADKPYDQFVIEQLAGDTVGEDRATGFLVGGAWDSVKSPDLALTLMQRQDELADMINATGTAFLGLTLGCARCHNHKFDPVLQKDYYAMQAVFAGVMHGERPFVTPAYRQRMAQAEQLAVRIEQLREQLAAWEKRLRPAVSPERNVEAFEPQRVRWVRFVVEATNDGAEPCLDELEVFAAGTFDSAEPQNLALASRGARATSSGDYVGDPKHRLEHLIDGQYGNGRSWISNTAGHGWVVVELAEPAIVDYIVWGRDRTKKYRDRLAVDYRIEVAETEDAWHTVASSADRLAPGEKDDPRRHYDLASVAAAQRARVQAQIEKLAALVAEHERLSAPPPMVYAGRFEQPEPTHRLYRGDPMQKREPVVPDALSVLGSLGLDEQTPEAQRRAALARWIASPQNPLTARVIVNRLWHYHFGTGLVNTPSDFGENGDRPSHPELLDWLARELIDHGWSLKHIHRQILTSATYRQRSEPRPEAMTVDAGSRLLWRFPPRRLEAEAIRDSILAVSGNLNRQMRGPGFSAFEPNDNYVRVYKPRETFDADGWRRMVYMTKVRMEQDGVFGAFDCPDAGQVCARRNQSTTAIQALNLLNSRFVLRQAESFARRIRDEAGPQVDERVDRAFMLAFCRRPQPEERQLARQLVEQHGLQSLCRALLNANEFLFLP